jgi:hypothetical protein
MGVEVVLHENDLVGLGKMDIAKLLENLRVVDEWRALFKLSCCIVPRTLILGLSRISDKGARHGQQEIRGQA